MNLRRICSAVIAAYRRRSSVVVNSDDDDSDDDDSTYVPEEECCDSDEEEAESLGIFLSMVHKASKKLGGKGLVVLDASGVSSKTNDTLWKWAKFFGFDDILNISVLNAKVLGGQFGMFHLFGETTLL